MNSRLALWFCLSKFDSNLICLPFVSSVHWTCLFFLFSINQVIRKRAKTLIWIRTVHPRRRSWLMNDHTGLNLPSVSFDTRQHSESFLRNSHISYSKTFLSFVLQLSFLLFNQWKNFFRLFLFSLLGNGPLFLSFKKLFVCSLYSFSSSKWEYELCRLTLFFVVVVVNTKIFFSSSLFSSFVLKWSNEQKILSSPSPSCYIFVHSSTCKQ